jgi:hypothetical protein
MKPPASGLVRERVAISALFRRVCVRVKAFVDHDPLLIEEHRPDNLRIETKARTWNAEKPTQVVELDAKLEVLFDNVVNGNRRLDCKLPRMRILGDERFRILLDRLIGHVDNFQFHRVFILICIVSRTSIVQAFTCLSPLVLRWPAD